jgi:hypothetical protein
MSFQKGFGEVLELQVHRPSIEEQRALLFVQHAMAIAAYLLRRIQLQA